jgi:hypothetical protein
MKDTITLLPKTAEAIGNALDQDFNTVETPERMAWIVLLLKRLPDEKFPHGKWGTIQSIEYQLKECADERT